MLIIGSAAIETLFGQLDMIYSDLNIFSSDKSSQVNCFSSQSNFKLPSYKMKNNIASYQISIVVADFTASTYATSEVQNKSKSIIKSNSENNTKPKYSYSYYQQLSATNYSSKNRNILPTTNESQSGTTINSKSNDIQSIGIFLIKPNPLLIILTILF